MPSLKMVGELTLDGSGFNRGLDAAKGRASAFGSALKSQLAAAFSVAAVVGYVKHVSEVVGRIKDLSEQFGVTTDEVQRADHALKQSGMQFEDLGTAMSALARNRRDAAEGNDELTATFRRFGVSAADLQNPLVRTFDILKKISEAQKDGTLTAKDQVLLMDLLGPRAFKLANIIGDLNKSQIEVISPDAVLRIDQATKYLEEFRRKVEQISASKLATILQLGSFLPGIGGGREELAKQFAEALAGGLAPAGQAAQKGIAAIAGAKPADIGNLFDRKEKAVKTSGIPGIQSDQFQRIGAFTGTSAMAGQRELAYRQLTVLEKLREDLTRTGIIIRGTD